MSQPVLHLDFIAFRPGVSSEQRVDLIATAAALQAIDGVEAIGMLEVDGEGGSFDVAFWFRLRDFGALEPFGTDPRYVRFLQGSVAPLLRGFAGADVTLTPESETIEGDAACLALTGPEETYDFEVREALAAWAQEHEAAAATIGVAVGERQMYRGAALVFGGRTRTATAPPAGPFQATLLRGAARKLS